MITYEDMTQMGYYNPEEFDQVIDFEEMRRYNDFDGYQDWTDSTAIYPEHSALEYVALGLASEAGEFAGKVKKLIRDGNVDVDDMISELGDCLWYIARAAAELEVHLSDVAKTNIDKLEDRKARDKIKGEGDNR